MRVEKRIASCRLSPALVLLVLGCAGCRLPEPGGMISIPPPVNWELQLQGMREQKDQRFRRGADTPLLAEDVKGFPGLAYWNPDPAFYFVGPVNRYPSPERMQMLTTAGKQRPCERYGWVSFPIDGEEYTLQVYRMLDNRADGAEGMFLPFQDGTTGKETYPAGRYVNLAGPAGGPYVLDFNLAHNPYCAYGAPERFACPVTPAENRLAVRIQAGEFGYRELPAGGK